jgi:hypothetical protein
MESVKSQPAIEPGTARKSKRSGAFSLALFGLPFAAAGLVSLVLAFRKYVDSGGSDSRTVLILGLCGLVFAGAGFCFIGFALFGKRASGRLDQKKIQHPDAPWRWRDDWEMGEIRPTQAKAAAMMWLFAFGWNGIAWAAWIGMFPQRRSAPLWAVALVALFPAIGLVLLGMAVRATLVWRRFAGSVLRLTYPYAIIGDALNGTIEINTRLQNDAPIQTRLTCLRRTLHKTSDSSHIEETVLWRSERTLQPDLPEVDAGHTGIPVFFRIPPDQPPATPGESGVGSVVWRVGVEAHIKGPNLQLEFEVPVFPGTVPEVPAEDPVQKYQMPAETLRQALHSRIRVNDVRNGREFVFPAGRNVGVAVGLTIAAAAFVFATVFLGMHVLDSFHFQGGLLAIVGLFFALISAIFPLVFGAVALVLTLFCLDHWFHRTRVMADTSSLAVTHSWLFLKWSRQFPVSEIAELFTKTGMTSGPGQKQYYDLKARLGSGKEITLGSSVPNQAEAEWLLAEFNRALGLRKTSGLNGDEAAPSFADSEKV